MVDLNLRQQWQDSRLSFESVDGVEEILVTGENRRIWSPDTYISSAADDSGARRSRVLIEPSGYVRVSEK